MSNALKVAAVGGVAAAETDEDFNQTVLLLHGDGTNGAQNNTFLDSSTNNFTITRNGNTTQGTFSPFSVAAGEFSNFFDGSGDSLSAASNAAFAFGTNDFTVEAWVFRTAAPTYVSVCAIGFGVGGFGLVIGNDGKIYTARAGTGFDNTFTANVPVNQWAHIAVSRSGTSMYCFVNGVQIGSALTNTVNYAQGALRIGTDGNGSGSPFPGYISNLRFVSSAVYTSAFTPPTAPLTAITNTSLLTCQSNRFVDNSTNAFAITRNGDVRVTPFSPFAPSAAYDPAVNGGSGYFDGTGDYLTAPDNAAFDFGSGDFTIELFVYFNASVNGTTIAFVFQGSSDFATNSAWAFTRHSGNKLRFISSPSNAVFTITDSTANFLPSVGQWYHLAAVRNSGTVKLYVDGVEVGSGANSTTIQNSSRVVGIGASSDGLDVTNGYMSNVRVVKGTAVYTAAFTPPTAPLTAISNTSLLLNFTNAGIFDNTGKNVLETVGNAQIDTTTKKYGTGSMEFDGTGDYLIPNGATTDSFAFGSGDFTIEFWVYLNNVSGTKVIYDGRPAGGSGATPTIYMSSASIRYFANGADRITGGNLSATTWYHIAVSRSGTSTKLFIDGTQSGSTYTDSTTYTNSTNRPLIGVGEDLGNGFNGYLDDLRITKGVARYTANFTAPTKAFADQ